MGTGEPSRRPNASGMDFGKGALPLEIGIPLQLIWCFRRSCLTDKSR
jgi:hypothetical protein